MVLSPQIWASLKQSHPICTFLPSKAPWVPHGPLGVNKTWYNMVHASNFLLRTSFVIYSYIWWTQDFQLIEQGFSHTRAHESFWNGLQTMDGPGRCLGHGITSIRFVARSTREVWIVRR